MRNRNQDERTTSGDEEEEQKHLTIASQIDDDGRDDICHCKDTSIHLILRKVCNIIGFL
jgi:hypothetical protein